MTAIAVVVGLIGPLGLAYSGLAVRLGAHPWWAQSSAWIGAVAGLVIALGLLRFQLNRIAIVAIGAAVVSAGAWAAHAGKTAFANSYAEDALAGRFWYWGWICGLAGLTLVLVTLLWPARGLSSLPVGNVDHA
ncbi:MAG: hypothetical protein AB7I59_09530 [Geminicoccaceae bacterium]